MTPAGDPMGERPAAKDIGTASPMMAPVAAPSVFGNVEPLAPGLKPRFRIIDLRYWLAALAAGAVIWWLVLASF